VKPGGGKRPEEAGFLYGVNPVLEALRSKSRSFDKLYVARRNQRGKEIREILDLSRERRVPVHFEERTVLSRLAGHEKHQGIVAVVSVKAYVPMESLLDAAKLRGEDPFLLILAGVEDPRNLGAILRTAEAAGVHGVILPERRSVGLTETVAKTSAGGLEYLPIARAGNLRQAVSWLKESGVWVMAVDPGGETLYDRMDYNRPLALLIGGEGKGIGPLLAKEADVRLSIPLSGHVTSLNVSVAAGVVIFEAARSRGLNRRK
jgi:23S rRNA (guanosine2251-2'-O)-methyltransferase